jgi:membrane dipeptidase
VIEISNQGKIACLIGVEGGHSIENSLPLLRMYYRLGARYMTLTHADSLAWAGASTDGTESSGLSNFGKEVVLEMNRLGMLVDISHVSVTTMVDTLEVSQAPIIASHSSAFSIAPHPRNVPDTVIERIAENGGVVMVNFFSGFIDADAARDLLERTEVPQRLRKEYPNEEEYQAELAKWLRARRQSLSENGGFRSDVGGLVDHIDHIVKVAGIDHVGLGSDYDGISSVPRNLEDVSTFPNITQELLNRGYCEKDILKILGGNTLRAMREAEKVAEMIAIKGHAQPNP